MKDQIRQSQIVMGFGPGAMVDLPNSSVMVAGLDDWTYTNEERAACALQEPRLLSRLIARFGQPNLELRRPPKACVSSSEFESSVTAWRFPRWFVAATDERTKDGYFRRRLIHRREIVNGKFVHNGKAVSIIPIRFVRACPRGHIDDIDWQILIHGGPSACPAPKWFIEHGNSGDLAEVEVTCDCGSKLRMSEAADRSRRSFGMCDGARPWLGPRTRETCGVPSQLLIRSASNAYFAERITAISIPASTAESDTRIAAVATQLRAIETERALLRVLRLQEPTKSGLAGLSDEEVWTGFDRLGAGVSPVIRPVKDEEFGALSSAEAELGADMPEGDFFASRLDPANWTCDWMKDVTRVVLVHRLRAVTVLTGFTRFESSSTDIHGELDKDVKPASLARDIKWLPATETRGEGIFLEFNSEAVGRWLARPSVVTRGNALRAGFDGWLHDHEGSHREFAGTPYIMLHSLSHLLMTAISLECGYAAASLQERVYALGSDGTKPARYGILLYTASNDAQGTLGGLIEAGRSIKRHMRVALESALLCSNDPVCAQHAPNTPGTAQLHGAACHGCILAPETSCEQRNDFLDRELVVQTVNSNTTGFFNGFET
ncbi:MAG: DUF1998 domain-containing protein [Phycisphaerales bacterium]|nr:DUF1998 domain-containing protein [Phycisphaerales bacterium]